LTVELPAPNSSIRIAPPAAPLRSSPRATRPMPSTKNFVASSALLTLRHTSNESLASQETSLPPDAASGVTLAFASKAQLPDISV
jgi:hypothetical protein